MRVLRVLSLAAIIVSLALVSGCACGTRQACQPEAYGDLRVCITTTMPLTYFYGCEAILEVWGPDGFYETKEVYLYMGNQMVIFRNVPIGRYVVTLSYSGMVVTKCALVCGNDKAVVGQLCMTKLKDMLTEKKRYGYTKSITDEFMDCGPDKNGICREPCPCCICFWMPDDVLIYDP